ncbi:hypothetical protein MP228_007238 [Amoeboaphelidium protococcarum]|nr:hypothetical protein MP228_007238 [Amoeboaphelidium protococcarum]
MTAQTFEDFFQLFTDLDVQQFNGQSQQMIVDCLKQDLDNRGAKYSLPRLRAFCRHLEQQLQLQQQQHMTVETDFISEGDPTRSDNGYMMVDGKDLTSYQDATENGKQQQNTPTVAEGDLAKEVSLLRNKLRQQEERIQKLEQVISRFTHTEIAFQTFISKLHHGLAPTKN